MQYAGYSKNVLGGSWVVIIGVISPQIGVRIIVTLLISPLITTHEPPSIRSTRNLPLRTSYGLGFRV